VKAPKPARTASSAPMGRRKRYLAPPRCNWTRATRSSSKRQAAVATASLLDDSFAA